MLKAIIENERFALTPRTCFIADANGAIFRDNKWDVANQPRIQHAVMGLDMCARL